MPEIKINELELIKGVDNISYPAPFNQGVGQYEAACLSDAAGLTQFGAYIEKLLPGGMSSQRHWHENEDEFIYVLTGEVTLVENDGETVLTEGKAAGWKAGDDNAHHLINRTEEPAYYLIVGSRAKNDVVHYPDIDLHYKRDAGDPEFSHKDGSLYELVGGPLDAED